MGKHSGYDIYWNYARKGQSRLIPCDWRPTKAAASRRVEFAYENLNNRSRTSGSVPQIVLAVDPDTGEVVAGKMEVK